MTMNIFCCRSDKAADAVCAIPLPFLEQGGSHRLSFNGIGNGVRARWRRMEAGKEGRVSPPP